MSAPRAPGRVPRPAGRRGPEGRARLLFPRGLGREKKRLRLSWHPHLSKPSRLEPTTRAPALHPVPFLKTQDHLRDPASGPRPPPAPRNSLDPRNMNESGNRIPTRALNPRPQIRSRIRDPALNPEPIPDLALNPGPPPRLPHLRARTPDAALSLRPRPGPAPRPRRLRPIPHPPDPETPALPPTRHAGDRPPNPEEQDEDGGR